MFKDKDDLVECFSFVFLCWRTTQNMLARLSQMILELKSIKRNATVLHVYFCDKRKLFYDRDINLSDLEGMLADPYYVRLFFQDI